MKRKTLLHFLFTLLPVLSASLTYSQGTWTQKTNVFTSPRAGAVGFSIGSKGYIGTGWQFATGVFFKDFWEWDQVTSSWTQKANFADSARGDATGFSIGDKGYIITGFASMGSTNKLWEWDQATNTWSPKAVFPGTSRGQAAAFSIGLKGYVGCGSGGLNDFWEYNPVTDAWTQVANIPVGRFTCVSFSIGNRGYICIGRIDATTFLDDTWEFDPQFNSWTQKANFPGGLRAFASGFSIGNKGYAGTGWDGSIAYSDFWCYDPSLNLWTQKASFPHAVTDIDQAGFSVGCKGYFGTGATTPGSSSTFYNDFWEYEPDTCSLTGIAVNPGNPFTLDIGPNPFSEKLNVSINSILPLEIIIYDANAKRVIQQKFTSSVTLNTTQLAKGIYIYEVKNKEGVMKGKVVKE